MDIKKGNYMHTKRRNPDFKYTQIPLEDTLYKGVYDVLYPFAKYYNFLEWYAFTIDLSQRVSYKSSYITIMNSLYNLTCWTYETLFSNGQELHKIVLHISMLSSFQETDALISLHRHLGRMYKCVQAIFTMHQTLKHVEVADHLLLAYLHRNNPCLTDLGNIPV